MCSVSMVADAYRHNVFPNMFPNVSPINNGIYSPISRPEFEELKTTVLQMKKDLEEARKQYIADGNPDCEQEDKVAIIKQIAKMVGVDLGDVFND